VPYRQHAYERVNVVWTNHEKHQRIVLMVYQHQKNADNGKKLVAFLKWAVTDGQKLTPALDYAPLPQSVQQRVLERIKTIKY